MEAPKGKLVKIVQEDTTKILVLQRKDRTLFCIREYRMAPNPTVGEEVQVFDCQEDGTYTSDTGRDYKLYSNEQKTKGTKTELEVDNKGECALSGFSTLSSADLLHLSGNAMILKSLATQLTIDECVQEVVKFAIKLKEQQ